MKSIKLNLNTIINNERGLKVIWEAIDRQNEIVTHAYFVLKLLLITRFEQLYEEGSAIVLIENPHPLTDRDLKRLIDVIMNLLTDTTIRKKDDLCFDISFNFVKDFVKNYIASTGGHELFE